jgi:hypothetical protein
VASKRFSLTEFLNEILPGLDGPELSWDFRIGANPHRFTIQIPIKLYGQRKDKVRLRVLDAAKKMGLEVSELRFQSDHDIILEGTFFDIVGEKN